MSPTSATAQGRSAAPPARARFSPAALRTVLLHYALGNIRSIRELHGGNPASPKALVLTEAGPVVVKRRAQGPGRAALHAAHQAQAVARAAGVATPQVLTAMGTADTTVLVDGHLYELASWAPGTAYGRDAISARAAGAALGLLHRAWQAWSPPATLPHRRAPGEADVMPAFDRLTATEPGAFSAGRDLAALWVWSSRLLGSHAGANRPVHGVVHGDMHGGNTLYRGHVLTALIDFDRAALASQTDEAASAAVLFAAPPMRTALDAAAPASGGPVVALDGPCLRAFIAGYLAHVPGREPGEVLVARMIRTLAEQAAVSRVASGGFGGRSPGPVLRYVAGVCRWLRRHGPVLLDGRLDGTTPA